jgi:hypothetical protein
MATFKGWIHRLNKLPLNNVNKHKEHNRYKEEQIIVCNKIINNKEETNIIQINKKERYDKFIYLDNYTYIRTIAKSFSRN